MGTASQILKRKGAQVLSIGPRATVHEAATRMNDHHVDSLVVLEDERLVGIFTERDILRRVVAEQRDPDKTRVEQVMTTTLTCCYPDTSLDQVRKLMMTRRIRHLPVICGDDQNKIVRLISIGDLNAHRVQQQQATIQSLEEYLYGPV